MRAVRRFVIPVVTVAIGLALSPAAARAAMINRSLGLQLHALLSSVYQYSFNNPDDDSVNARVSVRNHNDFDLNQASLFLVREKKGSPFGLAVTVDFGDVAETTVSDWDGDGLLSSAEETNSFELREAYATYSMGAGALGDIRLKGGKFVTLLGYEVIKTWDNINHNISESLLFGFAIPFTHTGALATIPFGSAVSLDLGVVNGWDNVSDNNDSKTLLAGLGITPADTVSAYIAGTFGAERNGRKDGGPGAGSRRGTITANMVLQPADEFTLVLDGAYGVENDIVFKSTDTSLPTGNADWYGAAAYGIVQLTERLSFGLRGEVFVDSDGTRISIPAAEREGTGVTIWEVTPTFTFAINDYLLTRFEYRHDEASQPIFSKGSSQLQTGSDTIAIELVGRI